MRRFIRRPRGGFLFGYWLDRYRWLAEYAKVSLAAMQIPPNQNLELLSILVLYGSPDVVQG